MSQPTAIPPAVPTFDYSDTVDHQGNPLTTHTASRLERHAVAIDKIQTRNRWQAVEGLLQLGKELHAARAVLTGASDDSPILNLERGRSSSFAAWVSDRVGISRSNAYRAIDVYRTFKDRPKLGQSIDKSALYLLAAGTTPEGVVDKAVQRSQSEVITHSIAKEMVESAMAIQRAREEEKQRKEDEAWAKKHQQELCERQTRDPEKYAQEMQERTDRAHADSEPEPESAPALTVVADEPDDEVESDASFIDRALKESVEFLDDQYRWWAPELRGQIVDAIKTHLDRLAAIPVDEDLPIK